MHAISSKKNCALRMLFLVLWGLVYRYTVHARQLKGKFVLHKKSGFYIGQLMDLSALLKYFQTSLFHGSEAVVHKPSTPVLFEASSYN
ncbi:uncharacterized protein LOC126603733 isoform X3 [Malus sylvestris]|uniref:uncharacterized protein LOC126603733 isoform X3 n=1 Tax=Malus sylvestris TaxID=3752 RepID=UPI0021AD0EF6|nr:uncharacterized protein LOC126603733 isoform X3 [Malus sylvestris]